MARLVPPDGVPVRIVCATRLTTNEFFAQTATGRSILAFRSASLPEIALYPNNSFGLGAVYNHAIEAAAGKPAILVFIHDDCLVADYYWMQRVRQGLSVYDIVGIVGNKRRLTAQPSWIVVDSMTRRLDDSANLSGAIGQGHSFPPEQLEVFGPAGAECKLLDGVFLASYSETLLDSGLRFDPQFAFHFYDMDFCRTAERMRLTMGTIPLSLVHASRGRMDQVWDAVYRRYLDKWTE